MSLYGHGSRIDNHPDTVNSLSSSFTIQCTVEQFWPPVIQRKGGGAATPPICSEFFFIKAAFFRVKAYISLCAFAMNEDGD